MKQELRLLYSKMQDRRLRDEAAWLISIIKRFQMMLGCVDEEMQARLDKREKETSWWDDYKNLEKGLGPHEC